MYHKRLFILFFVSVLTACSSINDVPVDNNQTSQDINTRNKQMSQLTSWTIAGKIAFINRQERQSATLYWQKNEPEQVETLNLSTLFGINVLALSRDKSDFTLEVDGKSYKTQDLDNLIYQLTRLNLPTRAMNNWLKGIAYLPSDQITYHKTTQLPESLVSYYNNKAWRINYSKYHHIGSFQLAKQLSISQGDLHIKIVIHSWHDFTR